MRALFLLLAAGCVDHDPCAGYDGTCIGLRVEGPGSVDQLQVHVSGAAVLDGKTPSKPSSPHALPVTTALFLSRASGTVDLVVDGLLGNLSVGEAAAGAQLQAGQHLTLPMTLAPLRDDLAGLDFAGIDLATGDQSLADLSQQTDQRPQDQSLASPDLASQDQSGLQPRYVFLLPARSSALGVHAALDVDCQAAAVAALLPSAPYKAVIAYPPDDNPADYLSLTQHRDILRPDGTKVAGDDDFFSASMMHQAAINELADGTIVATGCAYTSFSYIGQRISSPSDCNGWSDATNGFSGITGDINAIDSNWSFQTPILTCDKLSCHVYCIQQD